MNFIKKLFFLLVVIASNIQTGITINGVDINQIAKKGQVISYIPNDVNSENIAFIFKNGKLDIGTLPIEEESKRQMMESYEDLKRQKSDLHNIEKSDKITLSAGQDQKLAQVYFKCPNKLLLKAGQNLEINQSILSSKEIFLNTNNLSLSQCFINDSTYLQLETKSPTALFKIIRFSLAEGKTVTVQGNMDFEHNNMSKEFIVMNATKLAIAFDDKAFNE